jgi:hypothetical protein
MQASLIGFRIANVGAVVFTNHNIDKEPPVPIDRLAQVYLDSILNPREKCEIVSITPIETDPIEITPGEEVQLPAYIVESQGFIPGEGRMIAVIGDVEIGGEITSVPNILMGGGGESADDLGRIIEEVTAPVITGDDVVYPDQYVITVFGKESGCEVSQVVSWEYPDFEPGEGSIEFPSSGETLSGKIIIDWWAIDNREFAVVEIYVDDEKVGEADYGYPRPDVAKYYSGRPGAPNFGYLFELDTTVYENGTHYIKALIIDSSGNIGYTPHPDVRVEINN